MKRLLALPLMLFLMAISTMSQGQTVTSDLPDYAPGTTATITGNGFTAGEDILIHVDHFFDFYGHEDEEYTILAADNLDGSFVFYYEVGLDEAFDEFVLTASQASGKAASTYFTDGLINTNLELVAGSTSFAPGTSVTLTATLTYKIDSKTYAPLVGKAVHFSVFGFEVGAGTTNSSGVATYTINVTPSPIPTVTTAYSGTNGFRVDFNDDATYAKSFDNVNFEVVIACTPPAAPTSGGDQNICAESSIQTLTATATAPIGASVVWYDADGNFVLSPTWNQIGTKTYYAESQNTPTCVSVARTPVSLTINATPNAPTAVIYDMPYDGTSHAVSATVTGENVVVDWYENETGGIALGSAPARTNAGTTTAWAEARNTITGCKSANRTHVTVNITRRDATWTTIAASKTYGDADPNPLTTGSGNFLEVDNVTATYTRAEGEAVAGGPYHITATLSSLVENALDNYTITNEGTNFTINRRLATWTTNAASKTYGDADPDPLTTGSGSNFMEADGVTATYSRAFGQTVANSPYHISANLSATVANALDNYNITNEGADFTINKRDATWTTIAASKYCGQSEPSPLTTGSGSNFMEADNVTATYTRAVGQTVANSPYHISANLSATVANALDNYNITNEGADFTINSVKVEVTITNNPVEMGNSTEICVNVSSTSGNQDFTGIPVNYTFDDGNSTTTDVAVSGSTLANGTFCTTKSIALAEVYSITATAGCATAEPVYLAVYDPNGGFVTGGGWIISPVVSTLPYMTVGGKANFGFVSKYKKGSNIPEGNTQFQFQAGNLNFSSSSYTAGTLVVAGSQAIYKGVGTINGDGSYGFMVSAVDGQLSGGGGSDKFRIKIWDKASGATVYDNNENAADNATATTVLGGGSIVIHSAESKTKLAQITPDASANAIEPSLKVYPNPFTERLNIEFSYETDTKAKLEIFSVTGAKIETLYDGPVSGGQLYNFEYLPRLTGSQMVFYHLTLDGKTQVGKILFNERR